MNQHIGNDGAVTVEGDASSVVLRLAGELDLYNVDLLRDAVDELGGAHAVVVDLTEVTFIDSTVLGCLVRLRQQLADPGGLVLYGPSPAIRGAFAASGLDRYFAIADAA